MVWNLKCVLSRCVESPWYPCMWPGVHFLLFSQPPATNKPAAGEALDPAEAAWRVRVPSPPCGVAPPSEVMLGSRLLLSQHLYTCWVWLVQWERYDTLSFVSRESRVVRPSVCSGGSVSSRASCGSSFRAPALLIPAVRPQCSCENKRLQQFVYNWFLL